METGRDSGSSVDLRTGPPTNLGEGEQFNSGKKLELSSSPSTSELTSQDHFQILPNVTTATHPGATSPPTHDQRYLQSELHHTSSVTEKGDGSTINIHFEAHPTNPFGEAHPSALGNNSCPPSLLSSSQNPFLLPSDDTNNTHVGATVSEKLHGQGPLESELHQPFSVIQKGYGGMTNSSLSTYPAGSLGEAHHSSTGEMLGLHSSLAPSAYESSPGNPFEVPTNSTTNTPVGAAVSQKVDENHDQGHEVHHTLPVMEQGDWSSCDARTHPANTLGETHFSSSSQQLGPLFTFESAQNQQLADATDKTHGGATVPKNVESRHTFSVKEQGHQSMASSNLGTDSVSVPREASVFNPAKQLNSSVPSFSPASESSSQDAMHNSVNAASNSQTSTNATPKLGLNSQLASESSDDDIPISSMPKHGQQSSDLAGQYSVAVAPGTNNGSEIQNPPVQVMERPGDPATSSTYRIPSHVFSRNKSNAPMEWSTASNESLFSIHMGNMSFSRDIAWMSKSGELDKPGEIYMSGMPNAFPSNQPPPPPTVNKFNDISQRTSELHEGSRVTEAKAAETMREVIMETNLTTQNMRKGDLSIADGPTRSNRLSNSNNYSHHSDGSTKSFAFQVLTDGDRTVSSKGGEEKRKHQKQPEHQTLKETPDAAQNPKSTTNASQNKWLSCFTCCTFGH